MKTRFALLLGLLIGIAFSCTKAPDEPVPTEFTEEEMDAAIARARAEIDDFIDQMLKGAGESFSVRTPIQDDGKTEHFWLTDVSYSEGEFVGQICNEPVTVTNVAKGQRWTVKKEEISDWLFLRNGKIHGHYTLPQLLKTMSPEEAERYKSMRAAP